MTVVTENNRSAKDDGKVAFYNNPKIRGYFFQILTLFVVVYLGWAAVTNARDALLAQKIASGFGFLKNAAGYELSFSLLPFSSESTHFRAFLVGITNTLFVAVIGVILATLLGFAVGIARLSPNWLLSRIAYWYVEFFRNIPLLLILIFLSSLKTWFPQPEDVAKGVVAAGPEAIANTSWYFLATLRSVFLPRPVFGDLALWPLAAFAIGVVATLFLRIWARRRQDATGQTFPLLWVGLGLIIIIPMLVYFAAGMPIALEKAFVKYDPAAPIFRRTTLAGGMEIPPEFFALLIGLVIYSASFIAENVRAGIMSVSSGQTEASLALGLDRQQSLKLVVIPQAMRVIIPPLTNQYLNLTKNSSLATAIGYPDLYLIFAGSTLNLTNQAVEVIAMTMAVYLTISLLTSFGMNWYNRRKALVER